VFEPLLLEECAAQMLRGQEEGQVLTSQVSRAHPERTPCMDVRRSGQGCHTMANRGSRGNRASRLRLTRAACQSQQGTPNCVLCPTIVLCIGCGL